MWLSRYGPRLGVVALDSSTNVLQKDDGLRVFAPERQAAWLGLLRAHSELTRALEAELSAKHGVGLSAYELLNALAHADGNALRMSQLAEQCELSLSRVSRLMDQLEARGLVERRSCSTDSRVTYATLLEPGRALVRDAQDTFFSVVDERFLSRLDCSEVGLLGSLLDRLIERGTPQR
jgi:DNA-binding MarR family transcriptional regulator